MWPSAEKKDEKFEIKVEISNLRRMLEQIFRILYAGKPLVKGKIIEDYEDIEVFYNEPFDLLYEIKEPEYLPNGGDGSGSKPQTEYVRRDLNPRPSAWQAEKKLGGIRTPGLLKLYAYRFLMTKTNESLLKLPWLFGHIYIV